MSCSVLFISQAKPCAFFVTHCFVRLFVAKPWWKKIHKLQCLGGGKAVVSACFLSCLCCQQKFPIGKKKTNHPTASPVKFTVQNLHKAWNFFRGKSRHVKPRKDGSVGCEFHHDGHAEWNVTVGASFGASRHDSVGFSSLHKVGVCHWLKNPEII